MTGPRDWDKEMAEIDKIIASGKTPPAAGPASVPARVGKSPAAETPTRSGTTTTVTRRRDALGVWLRVLVGGGGVAALQVWPYGKGCGTMLYLYMLSTVAVTLLGAWAMRGAWVHRRGIAHVAALLVFMGGLTFAAIQVLERTSYAAVPLGWTCP